MDNTKAVEQYLKQLNSTDENERSTAAGSLHKLKHPAALAACLKTINDAPDLLHLDYTPAVHWLIEIGEPALAYLADLLVAEDEMTRLRALRALEGITLKIWKAESVQTEKETMDNWQNWWRETGYVFNKDVSLLNESVKKIKDWILQRNKTD